MNMQSLKNEALVSQQDLKNLFWLNRDTGDLMNRSRRNSRAPANAIAGSLDTSHGCRRIQINKVKYHAHRLVWLYHHGVWPDKDIDHIDGNPLNNRIENLRVVTNQENSKNQKLRCTNTSGVMGAYFHKRDQKWIAQIKVDGKLIFLGYFGTFEEAVAARKSAESFYGFHENHGRTA